MIDVRQVYNYSTLFNYNAGWRIIVTFTEKGGTGTSYTMYYNSWIPQPSGYYVSETDGFIFTFNSKKEGTITISTEILKSKFETQNIGFYNITKYKLVNPYRNVFGTAKSYIALIYSPNEGNPWDLPDNLFVIKDENNEWIRPPFTIGSANSFESIKTYSNNTSSTNPTTDPNANPTGAARILWDEFYINQSESNSPTSANNATQWPTIFSNFFQNDQTAFAEYINRNLDAHVPDMNVKPPDDWGKTIVEKYFTAGGKKISTLTYFPYFSNCEYYGSHVYFPLVYEASDECDLKTPEETTPINP
jgi:hypothetical protein